MSPLRVKKSVVVRLVASLVVGGLVVSVGHCILELRRSESRLRDQLTVRSERSARNLQYVLKGSLDAGNSQDLWNVLSVIVADEHVRAVRVTMSGSPQLVRGEWPDNPAFATDAPIHLTDPKVNNAAPHLLRMVGSNMAFGDKVSLNRMTIVHHRIVHHDRMVVGELLIDGPAAREHARSEAFRALTGFWLFLLVTLLLGLLLVRRWITGPLSELMGHIAANAGPEAYYRVARDSSGEFAQLADALGGMLMRLESTTEQLVRREQAFQNLYQFAPAAMVTLDSSGAIVEANRRAAQLLHLQDEEALIGHRIVQFVRSQDRSTLRQAIDRLDLDREARCEMRLVVDGRDVDVAVECSGVRDGDGVLQNVRLSLIDISKFMALQRQLGDKSRLLNLLIDHMSDGILLIDAKGSIAAYNQRMSDLLHVSRRSVVGEKYDADTFWDDMGVVDRDAFLSRVREFENGDLPEVQQRVETQAGIFMFDGIVVRDGGDNAVGRMWVVQEITSQEQNKRLFEQQIRQLQALKKLTRDLCEVSSVDELLERVSAQLFDVFGVEAVGLALRCDDNGQRSRQVINRGDGPCLIEPNRKLVDAIERQLMPAIMSRDDVSFWPDLPRARWSSAVESAGLTCIAGGPLIGGSDAQGILWIARRGGQRLERHHIYLLEALAPIISARLEVTQLLEQMHRLELTDLETDMPNQRHLTHEMTAITRSGVTPWSLLVVKLEPRDFASLSDRPSSVDAVLRAVGNVLRRGTRRSCFVARLAGTAFGIIAPRLDSDAAAALAERLIENIAALPGQDPDVPVPQLSASVGVAVVSEGRSRIDEVLYLAQIRAEIARRSPGHTVIASGPQPDSLAG